MYGRGNPNPKTDEPDMCIPEDGDLRDLITMHAWRWAHTTDQRTRNFLVEWEPDLGTIIAATAHLAPQ
jgi:hypothetical protein